MKIFCKDDNNERLELSLALDQLKNDINQDVSETAFDSDTNINVKYKETDEEYKKKKDREEKLKKYEKEMEQKDIHEEEEVLKNKNNEE